jgi:hypothetical protein
MWQGDGPLQAYRGGGDNVKRVSREQTRSGLSDRSSGRVA